MFEALPKIAVKLTLSVESLLSVVLRLYLSYITWTDLR
jgi:hypothetical protein